MQGYKRQGCYIAAQGPMPNTIGDFWRMIWEKRLPNIVMLTKCLEAGRVRHTHTHIHTHAPVVLLKLGIPFCMFRSVLIHVVSLYIFMNRYIHIYT